MLNEDWQNNSNGNLDIHGFRGDYTSRGGKGRGEKGYKDWSEGPLLNILKSKLNSAN